MLIGSRERITLAAAILAGALWLAAPLRSQEARVVSVDPATAKVGDVVTITGDGIDKGTVDTLYLTDGKTDIQVDMTEQSAKTIKFKVPEQAKSHRWAIMVHTTKNQLIEEPVRVQIE